MRALPVALVLALLLAGCGGSQPGGPGPGGPSEVGRIQGRVVDDSFDVVPGASVRLLVYDRSTSTGPDGAFEFDQVAAGPVRVVASREGFSTQTRSGLVVGGQTLEVVFTLNSAPRQAPFNKTERYSGQVVCGLPQSVACGPDETSRGPSHRLEVSAGLAGILVELDWSPPASGVADRLALDVMAATPSVCGAKYAGAQGTRPVRLEVLDGFPISGGHQCIVVRGTGDATVVNQSYSLYVTLFFHAPMPPGFSALPRG